jgi:hypothetical protein
VVKRGPCSVKRRGGAIPWRSRSGQGFAAMVRGQDPQELVTRLDLFVTQGHQRVDASGALRGQQTGGDADEHDER